MISQHSLESLDFTVGGVFVMETEVAKDMDFIKKRGVVEFIFSVGGGL